MVDVGPLLSDPWTVRTIASIVAGAVTALVVVRLSFYLQNQRDLFNAVRAIRTELDHDVDHLGELAELLVDDMGRQQVDMPIEVPAGTTMEVRYVLSLPSSIDTSAFDQLRRSGQLLSLPPELRRDLFDLYDAIDRVNRLHRHREELHFAHVENVHVVVDSAGLDLEPGETAAEADLPPETAARLSDLRRMRGAMKGINAAILRLVAALLPRDAVEEHGLEAYREDDPGGPPDVRTVTERLEALERDSFWSRFV